MNPGWYPDPDDENARRYWDGESWSAPLPRESSSPVTPPPVQTDPPWVTRAQARPAEPQWASAGGDAALVCPHCQQQGFVTSREVKMKKGISGGKATGALVTLGVSMLATGLSRKEKVTEMRCGKCRTIWHV